MKSRDGIGIVGVVWCGLLSLLVLQAGSRLAWANNPALTPPAGLTAPEQQVSMPMFRLPSIDGGTVDAASLHGKVVVVRFWATW